MNLDGAITRFRTMQAALFDTAVTITRAAGPAIFDPDTGAYTPLTPTSIYTGPALVRPSKATVVDAADTSIQLAAFDVKLPPDTPVALGDTLEVTASAHAPSMVGLVARILDVTDDEWQVTRRAVAVQENVRPA